MTDTELVEASRRGERGAFGRLVAKYQDVVWAVSYSSTRDRALGDDVTQDTFIAAWRQLDQLRDAATVRPWLCGIARNLARRARRRTRRECLVDVPDAVVDGTPFEHTAAAEAEAVVRDALARVPDRYREVLVLYYREGRSLHEVADSLALSEANVLQRLARGRRYLADGVARLVERSLERARPRRNIVAGVLAGIASLTGLSRVDASQKGPASSDRAAPPPGGAQYLSKGSTMLKLVLATSVLAAAGTTAAVVHAHSSTATADLVVATSTSTPTVAAIAPAAGPVPRTSVRAPALPKAVGPTCDTDPSPPGDKRVISPAELARLGLDKGPSRGDADAPVTIVAFQDGKCPYCEHSLATLDQLLDEYPHKLRIIVKQFTVHPSAELAAEATYAADAQGKFWDMHDAVFQHQDALSRDDLIEYAGDLGLDVAAFTVALDHHDFKQAVTDDEAAGKELGVEATPWFLVNGRQIQGAQPIEVFRKAVDDALAHPNN
jgi:RNA polymerase sigma factor (sigma-70 family)